MIFLLNTCNIQWWFVLLLIIIINILIIILYLRHDYDDYWCSEFRIDELHMTRLTTSEHKFQIIVKTQNDRNCDRA